MTLEDHLGDIVAKGRAMSGARAGDVAQAAGLAPKDLEQLEQTGRAPAGVDWAALGKACGLDGSKLAGIAQGWLPRVPDLQQWRELRVITTDSGGMGVNCYLVWDEVTREAALFDTGWEAEPIEALIAENQLDLKYILITHSHGDHIAALDALRQRFSKARVRTSRAGAPVDQRNRPNEFIHLGSLRITHRNTPGHAEDGTTYIVGTWPEDAPHVAIVGDAIFAGSMGRGNQSWDLARGKVREQILSLPPETLICPGHGPLTTVAEEKAHNPFF